jgi:hypothetical protein
MRKMTFEESTVPDFAAVKKEDEGLETEAIE